MSDAQRLADQLSRYFVKKTGVFLPFNDATDGLTAAQALLVPHENFNSIWRVVNHVGYWIEFSLLVLQDSDSKPTTLGGEAGGWYAPEHATDDEWFALRTRTIELNTQLTEATAALNAEQLHIPTRLWKQTPFEIVESMIAHNSYHTCEVISLRHLQGLWVKA
jgi:hypothetical protein